MKPHVAVIGAGVSGLTTATLLAEGGWPSTIFAAEVTPHTTSAAAAAIWYPYDAAPADAVTRWSLRTYEVLRALSADARTGVSMLEQRLFVRTGEIEIPAWARSLGAKPLQPADVPKCFTSGFVLQVPLTDTTRYLGYLAERFDQSGGEIRAGVYLNALEEVSRKFALIVNCAGIGAKTLVPDDELEPHRGQVAVVAKLQLRHAVVCDDPPLMYAIPRANDCVFGGTNDVSFARAADPGATRRILQHCSEMLGIAPPPVLDERVGLRPFRRTGVCLCAHQLADGRTGIHNYGHGGSGFTLSWGCAEDVLALGSTASRLVERGPEARVSES